jgi:hypothetical protein
LDVRAKSPKCRISSMRELGMTRRSFILLGLFTGCLVSTGIFAPSPGWTQSDQVKASMAALLAKTKALGAPKIEGVDPIGGKEAPALYFGSTKINNSFDLVDALAREQGGVATLFAKSGDDFIRVSTNVKKDDGSRAIGTVLDPKGPVIAVIRKGESYYGDANILSKPYVTGYEPIRDAAKNVIGIYFVGYPK